MASARVAGGASLKPASAKSSRAPRMARRARPMSPFGSRATLWAPTSSSAGPPTMSAEARRLARSLGERPRLRSRAKRSSPRRAAPMPSIDCRRSSLAIRASNAAASAGASPARAAVMPPTSTMASSRSAPQTRAASIKPRAAPSKLTRLCRPSTLISGGMGAGLRAREAPEPPGRRKARTMAARAGSPARRTVTGPRRSPGVRLLSMLAIIGRSAPWNSPMQARPLRAAPSASSIALVAPTAKATSPLSSTSTSRSAAAKARPSRRRGSRDKGTLRDATNDP